MNLYEVTEELREIEAQIETQDGEMDDELLETYLRKRGDLEAAMIDAAGWIKNKEAEIAALRAEIDRLQERHRSLSNRVRRFRDFFAQLAMKNRIKQVKTPLWTITVRESTPAVEIEGDDDIPPDFWIEQPPKLDKNALREFLTNGGKIEGVKLITYPVLQIR